MFTCAVHWMHLQKQRKKHKAPTDARFSALHLIHDPQEFAEKLFQRLERATEKFDIKLMMMALIAQLIGVHKVQYVHVHVYLHILFCTYTVCTCIFSIFVHVVYMSM